MSKITGISYEDAFALLCLRAEKSTLLCDGIRKIKDVVPPFLVGSIFPEIYLEFPLKGQSFLDVSLLYGDIEKGTVINSPRAVNTEKMLDCYADIRRSSREVCCGFEIDIDRDDPPAAVHFEPYGHTEYVMPFCESLDMGSYGSLYLETAERMRTTWPLSFFGMFRGRDDAPLRVCGYLDQERRRSYADDPETIEKVFESAGFTAYDRTMTQQICTLMKTAPCGMDYQMDIYPDNTPSDVLAFDVSLPEISAGSVRSSFETGASLTLMKLFEKWDIVDERWKLIADTAQSFMVPTIENEKITANILIFRPAWLKVRWKNRQLQDAKCYCRMMMSRRELEQ